MLYFLARSYQISDHEIPEIQEEGRLKNMSTQAMFHHPVIAIQTGIANFSLKSKPISLKLEPGEFERVKTKINQEVEKFTLFTDATIDQFDLKNDAEILKYQEEGKREILMSALAPEFIAKYQTEILYEDTFKKLIKFVTEIIGSQSENAKSKAAREKMSKITRDSSTDEKFSRFLIRLQRLAEIVTDNKDVQKFLVNQYFDEALSPTLKTFLREKEKNKETPENIASFLDKLGKHKKVIDLNSLEISSTDEKFNQLNDKIDSLQNEMRALMRYQKSKEFEAETAELFALKKIPQNQPRQKTVTFSRPQVNNHNRNQKESFPPHWELNRFGRPFRCRKCGLRGHRDQNCTGTDFVCRICHTVGHIQAACPKREINSNQKN